MKIADGCYAVATDVVVKVGQVWIDRDPRMNGRKVTVQELDDTYAYCKGATKVRIRLDRLAKHFKLATPRGGETHDRDY